MALNTYIKGDLVKLTASFAVAGVATDPTAVTCTVKDPTGTETTPQVTKDSTGTYHATVDTTNARSGVWRYEFTGTGVCQAALMAEFFLEASPF